MSLPNIAPRPPGELEELKRLTSEVEEPVIEIEREGVDVVIDLREKSSVVPAKQALPPI